MSTYNTKTGYIEVTPEDKENLQSPLPKNWSKNIINKIIWGEEEKFYDK